MHSYYTNLPEAKKLIGRDDLPVEDIAKCIIDYGPSVVLFKGGHSNEINSRDFLYDGENKIFSRKSSNNK